MNRIGTHKTVVLYQDNNLEVYYHDTPVVKKYANGEITLNTGGWLTPTTKRRMNQVSEAYNLGYKVYQKNYNWYVDYKGETIPFFGSENPIAILK